MKHKLLTLFLALAASVAPLFAQSGYCGTNLIWTLSGGTLTISGTGPMTDYDDYNAKAPWYSYGTFIKTVIIEDGVTSIGQYAFYYCTSLTSITIPNGVTSIGSNAFYWCSSLTSVTIPNSVTSIGERAFCYCSSLTSITIPNSVTSIGSSAFSGCSSLTSVTIPNSVTSIGLCAFYNCSSLTSVTIPNSVTSIGSSAFSDCSSLTSVTIPNSVTSIGSSAFYGCSSLTSVNISDIAAWCKIAFSNFTSNPLYYAHNLYLNGTLITDLVIPDGVTSIGERAFRNCTGLTSVTIPNTVTSIGAEAFEECRSLTSITIPNSVTSIGESAFEECRSLTSITIPNSVTSIGEEAFRYCSSLTSIMIPNSVTRIEYCAFWDCSSLTSVTIPNSVTSIGSGAFYGCSSLTSITIPNSVTSIENYAFQGCDRLTSITIPNSVTSIGEGAFYVCRSLTSITCEAVNPPTLGDKVFEGVNKSIPLYVPSSAVQKYKSSNGWKDFTNILPIGSQSGDVTTPTITVTTTSADIAWPQISGAASYELVIKDKSGNVVCTLVFDAEGHLTSLNFGAPDRDNIRKQPQAGTFSFTVTGLKENTEYTYTLTAKDSQGKAIDTKTGTFKTSGGTPVDETERDAAPAPRKQMKNGILRILTPDGITYDLQGHRLF